MLSLEKSTAFDYLIVIPTMAEPDVLGPTMQRLVKTIEGTRTLVVLSVNAMDEKNARAAIDLASPDVDGCEIMVANAGGPVGFAKAVNLGLDAATRRLASSKSIPETTVILNDDVNTTPGWLQGIRSAFDAQTVRQIGEPPGPDGTLPDRGIALYGKVGLVGPCSTNVAGLQQIQGPPEMFNAAVSDPDGFAVQHRQLNPGNYLAAGFLSGFCIALSFDCLLDLAWVDESNGERLCLFDERYGIGGYEDNDLCVRAESKGWRCLIAGDTYVNHRGHCTLDRHYAGQKRGLANRMVYYNKWAEHTQRDQRLVAAYRIGFRCANDLHLLRGSISRVSVVADGIAVVLTSNPLGITKSYDFEAANGSWTPYDIALFNACSNANQTAVAEAFKTWVKDVIAHAPESRRVDVTVETWANEWNERDERNRTIELAERLKPDWILSVDHDEVLEDRIDRRHFDRLMTHPDPMVRSWDFGWLNHWDTDRLCRVDNPWSDGDTYMTGMRGFRLWRSDGRRILAGTENGLHCGNCPDHDQLAKRVGGIRFRHYGYIRPVDRAVKQQQYTNLDPRPNQALVGGHGYAHLTHEEGMRLSPFVARDGVAVGMLAHSGEDMEDVARWCDALYGVSDRIVLVWTDEEDYGPEWERLFDLFGVEVVRHKFEKDLSACRNAMIDAVRGDNRIGWIFMVDPDEWMGSHMDALTLRRMAESSDAMGFMVRFANLRPDGSRPTPSESIRFFRNMDPMRFSGRVHEGFDKAMDLFAASNIHPQIRFCPVVFFNRGLAGDDATLERKLRKYTEMLLMEIEDDPRNPGAWVSLGLQYANEGRLEEARICYERGCSLGGQKFLPMKELMVWHMREARNVCEKMMETISPSHPYAQEALKTLEWLKVNVGSQPLLGMARVGQSDSMEWLPPASDLILRAMERDQEIAAGNGVEPEGDRVQGLLSRFALPEDGGNIAP